MTETAHEQTSPSDDPLDQATFVLNEKQTTEFAELLSTQPRPNEALRELMARTPPWETGKD
jgi:uncharacterized protein (DUF1778 family)